jgi:hypothetical protein
MHPPKLTRTIFKKLASYYTIDCQWLEGIMDRLPKAYMPQQGLHATAPILKEGKRAK